MLLRTTPQGFDRRAKNLEIFCSVKADKRAVRVVKSERSQNQGDGAGNRQRDGQSPEDDKFEDSEDDSDSQDQPSLARPSKKTKKTT